MYVIFLTMIYVIIDPLLEQLFQSTFKVVLYAYRYIKDKLLHYNMKNAITKIVFYHFMVNGIVCLFSYIHINLPVCVITGMCLCSSSVRMPSTRA